MSESSSSDNERVIMCFANRSGIYTAWCKEDAGPNTPRQRKSDIVDTLRYPQSDPCHMQDVNLTTVGGDTVNYKLRFVECAFESLDGTFKREVRLT